MKRHSNNDRYIEPSNVNDSVELLSDGIFTFDKATQKLLQIENTSKSNILFV